MRGSIASFAACWATALLVCAAPGISRAAEQEIFELDLEDIIDLEISSVSKRTERASEAAAAVYVLTGDEIRRSGARSIPDALRGVPGLHVAQLSGGRWSVSARGFSNLFSDKLLVLRDGRSVYTPLFAGVYWDVQDVAIDEIDRIEVIRGPGGTLWGSNAVNGVINILTKRAAESQGTYLQAGGGVTERVFATARRGGRLGQIGHWRMHGKYFQRTGLEDNGTTPGEDPSDQVQGGFRTDFVLGPRAEATLQGDVYHGHSQSIGLVPDPTTLALVQARADGDVLGGNGLMRATFQAGEGSEAIVQLSYAVADRDDGIYDYHLGTFDAEAQQQFPLLGFANLTWGAGYRLYRDDIDRTSFVDLDPERRTYDLVNGFAQADLHFLEGKLRLTVGSKLEHNDFTGLEHQPSARIAFLPTPRLTIWGAASRAARTPSRGTNDVGVTLSAVLPPTSPLPTEVQLAGDDDVATESLEAYELGFRLRPHDSIVIDLAGFYNRYDSLQTFETGPLFCTDGALITGASAVTACAVGGNRLRQTLPADNKAEAQSKGLEVLVRFQPAGRWQLDFAYTYFHIGFDLDGDSTAGFLLFDEDQWPDHQFSVRSRLNPRDDLALDAGLYYVDELSGLDVDAYFRWDVRVAWKLTDRVELSLVGQNLIEKHEELSTQPLFLGTRIPRSVFAMVTWRY